MVNQLTKYDNLCPRNWESVAGRACGLCEHLKAGYCCLARCGGYRRREALGPINQNESKSPSEPAKPIMNANHDNPCALRPGDRSLRASVEPNCLTRGARAPRADAGGRRPAASGRQPFATGGSQRKRGGIHMCSPMTRIQQQGWTPPASCRGALPTGVPASESHNSTRPLPV